MILLFFLAGVGAATEKRLHVLCPVAPQQRGQTQTVQTAWIPVTAIASELLGVIAENIGYTFEIIEVPEKRALLFFETGQADAVVLCQIIGARQSDTAAPEPKIPAGLKDVFWSDPLFAINKVLLSLSEASVEYTSPEALVGLSIGVVADTMSPVLDSGFRIGAVTRIEAPDELALLELLYNRQLDAILLSEHVALSLIQATPQFSRTAFYFSPKPVEVLSYRILFSQQEHLTSFFEAFNKQLREMKQDGTLMTVLKKYLLLSVSQ